MITLTTYDKNSHIIDIEIKDFINLSELNPEKINWINIESNRGELSHVNALLAHIQVPELMKQEIQGFVERDHSSEKTEGNERRKHQFFDGVNFLKLQMVYLKKNYFEDKTRNTLDLKNINSYFEQENVYILATGNYILTIQEGKEGDVFGDIRNYIINNNKNIKCHKTNHLFYELLNAILDEYFFITNEIRENVENLEQRLFNIFHNQQYDDSNHALLQDLMAMKNTIHLLRKYTIPLKTELNEIKQEKECSLYYDEDTNTYYDVVHDRIDELLTYYDHCNELFKDLMDLHMSLSGAQMNQIMKTLTILSVVFIPLTFIAGLYGMNFEHMPELHMKYGYFATLILMVFVGIGMLWYIKIKKKWA